MTKCILWDILLAGSIHHFSIWHSMLGFFLISPFPWRFCVPWWKPQILLDGVESNCYLQVPLITSLWFFQGNGSPFLGGPSCKPTLLGSPFKSPVPELSGPVFSFWATLLISKPPSTFIPFLAVDFRGSFLRNWDWGCIPVLSVKEGAAS